MFEIVNFKILRYDPKQKNFENIDAQKIEK